MQYKMYSSKDLKFAHRMGLVVGGFTGFGVGMLTCLLIGYLGFR